MVRWSGGLQVVRWGGRWSGGGAGGVRYGVRWRQVRCGYLAGEAAVGEREEKLAGFFSMSPSDLPGCQGARVSVVVMKRFTTR